MSWDLNKGSIPYIIIILLLLIRTEFFRKTDLHIVKIGHIRQKLPKLQ